MAAITDIILVFLFFLIVLHHWSRKRNSFTTNWPVLGMLPGVFRNASRVHDYVIELLKHGDQLTFVFKGPWFSNMDFLITGDPMNVHHVFSKNYANYPLGPEFKSIMEPLGDGILNSDGDMWRIQRKMIHSLMKDDKYKTAVRKTIHQKVEKGLIPVLDRVSKQGMVVDLQDVFQSFTFDSICILVLGFDPNCLSVDKILSPTGGYEKAFDDIDKGHLYRHMVPESFWKLQKRLQIGQEKKLSKAVEIFDKFLYDCISTKREKLSMRRKPTLEAEDEEFDLLTSLFAQLQQQQENAISDLVKSDKFIRDMAYNLVGAGRSTVSAALVWFFWLVATHPSVEKKIVEELKENSMQKQFGDQWKLIFDTEEVSKLVYLHGAICEALRLYPPIPFEHRNAIQSDVLPSGHRVDANTKLLFSIYAMGRNEEVWGKDCLEFKPERWISKEGKTIRVPSYNFFTFLAGPRTCLGKDTVFIQIKMVATSILWNYHVHVEENHPITPLRSILLHMKYGLKVRVSKRSHV